MLRTSLPTMTCASFRERLSPRLLLTYASLHSTYITRYAFETYVSRATSAHIIAPHRSQKPALPHTDASN
jgi:hypothetical protein